MTEQGSYEELRNEIQRLREGQRRLQEEQENLRRHNGHPASAGGQNQKEPENEPDKRNEKKQDKKLDEPKRPVGQRMPGIVARHPLGVLIGAGAAVVLIIAGIFVWNYLDSYESTDDAEIDGHLNAIGSRVAGTVSGVYIENNRFVKAGQALVDLDPRDYKTALEQARAAYAQAQAALEASNPSVAITETTNVSTISTGRQAVIAAERAVSEAEQEYAAREANVVQAEAQNAKAQTDVARYRALVGKQEVSREQFDAVTAAAKTQAAGVVSSKDAAEAAGRAVEERRAELAQTRSRLAEAQRNAPRQVSVRRADVATRRANVVAAKARLDQALLNVSYTKIVAPVAGIIVDKTVEVGQRIQPGEQLFEISQTRDIWVTANFKETQLKRIRPGQSADVHVDAFDRTYHGYIDSMPGATGAITSLLPPENATGNFVKVVQRLPVRIRFKPGEDPEHRLRLGMSVEPKVWLWSNAR